jgi:hypothetical protein
MRTMTLDIRRWGVGQLVGGWAAYWAGLAIVTLTPFALTVSKLAGPGDHGTASLSLGDNGFLLTALKDGVTVYTATAPLVATALWIAVPPLALWALWLAMRPSRADRDAPEASGAHSMGALPDAKHDMWSDRASRVPSPLPGERRESRSQ